MKFLRILLILAVAFSFAAAAYAETQSVKVSGDITLRTFLRQNYNLRSNDPGPAQLDESGLVGVEIESNSSNWNSWLMSTAEIQVDADLTDNVKGVIRLINQREWGDRWFDARNNGLLGDVGLPFPDQVVARNPNIMPASGAFEVKLDLAYIELKEFLYTPLTLRLGRQDLWFGRGFIVGANLHDPNDSIYAKEYTAQRSFDAVRATFDYDPWTIDGVFAKIRENYMESDDDQNLWGVNVGYVFNVMNAEAEGYYWYLQRRYSGSLTAAQTAGEAEDDGGVPAPSIASLIAVRNGVDDNDVHTLGLRGSFDPIENWTLALEAAVQTGHYIGINNQKNGRMRAAWACDAELECRYFQDKWAWKPVMALEYIFYSGEEDMYSLNVNMSGHYNGWDPIFRGKFDTAIREFQNWFYRTNQYSCPSFTNQHQILFKGTLEPTDSLECKLTYGHFWLAERISDSDPAMVAGRPVPRNSHTNIGDEVDVEFLWDYTEDVQFGFLAAWFMPGNHFDGGQGRDTATDLVGTVKLSF